jgi:hypothetical protein
MSTPPRRSFPAFMAVAALMFVSLVILFAGIAGAGPHIFAAGLIGAGIGTLFVPHVTSLPWWLHVLGLAFLGLGGFVLWLTTTNPQLLPHP